MVWVCGLGGNKTIGFGFLYTAEVIKGNRSQLKSEQLYYESCAALLFNPVV